MIVLISVCPVLRSLPASGAFGVRGELDERGNVGRQVRRRVRVGNALPDRRVRVDHARRDARIVRFERPLERRHRLVRFRLPVA